MTGFMEDEVDQVQEVENDARGQREAVDEDEDREAGENSEADQPPHDTHLYDVLTPPRQRDTAGALGAREIRSMVRRRRPGIALALFERVVAKQILVVDDEAYLRDVHVLVLSAAGYAATALATAVEALTRLADIRPDLILLDMSLPGMDGREFLKRLRASALWRRLPVILSSGFPTDDIAALAETNTEVLAKPFTDVALLTRVRGLIGEA
ncbi:MAG: hypothetical protein DMD85_04290 [Candidatus Rokuibacteriota bacterium]|nr:MAG: hypothetical protein DMD85_04290 [Candidatus Rokubacteria bacterium]